MRCSRSLHRRLQPEWPSRMIDLAINVLYYGDNLDPPFNSNRDSNVIFRDE
jgi:hypothetical protein